ncbi:Magnesium transporter MRS2-2 [Hibiscus syriacus]|uniref:Magnesium transporter n=1 Tax=Hibiscus syriacus TaxID=106335 RepID=A0A6A3AAJ3_HIBSY|nr:Magnesium transporter MRS2-2 [Hibiscus syriacus]
MRSVPGDALSTRGSRAGERRVPGDAPSTRDIQLSENTGKTYPKTHLSSVQSKGRSVSGSGGEDSSGFGEEEDGGHNELVSIDAKGSRVFDIDKKGHVLNLEIKAIITAEEVCLETPFDDNVIPIVAELKRRLPQENLTCRGQGEEEHPGLRNYTNNGEENEFPFEFWELEVALEAICGFLDARTTELETDTYPALDELTSMVRDELEQLLDDDDDDDDDMAGLYLSRKLAGACSPAYFTQIDSTLNKLTTLREHIDDTEDYINIQLDNHRNQLIQQVLFLSSGTVCLSIYSLVAAIFGMSIPYTWREGHVYMFKWVVMLTGLLCTSTFTLIMSYARHKGLIGS